MISRMRSGHCGKTLMPWYHPYYASYQIDPGDYLTTPSFQNLLGIIYILRYYGVMGHQGAQDQLPICEHEILRRY